METFAKLFGTCSLLYTTVSTASSFLDTSRC